MKWPVSVASFTLKSDFMKVLVLLSFFICLNLGLQAQNPLLENSNVLKISPVEFARAEFKLSYERYFNDRKHGLLLSPTIIMKGEEGDERIGWRAMMQYRHYLSHLNTYNENDFLGISNIGFYAGVYGLYLDYKDIFDLGEYDPVTNQQIIHKNERSIKAQEGGALVGLQLDLTRRFVIDFYVGGGIRFSSEENSVEIDEDFYSPSRGGIFPYAYNGVKPTFGLMVGLLF